MLKLRFLVTLILLSLSIPALSQDKLVWPEVNTTLDKSIVVSVQTPTGRGSGCVVYVDESNLVFGGYYGLVLTAFHVISDTGSLDESPISYDKFLNLPPLSMSDIQILYHCGKKAPGGIVVAHSAADDLAYIWVWVPKDQVVVNVSKTALRHGDKFTMLGLGGPKAKGHDFDDIRCFDGYAAVNADSENLYADFVVIPGDSGCPAFNEAGEVCGVIQGGFTRFTDRYDQFKDDPVVMVWPLKAGGVAPINKYYQKALDKIKENLEKVEEKANKDNESH